jgi:hypothetical protein
MSLFDQLKVQIENNVPLPSVSNTPKRRGRPPGAKNKQKTTQFPIVNVDAAKIEQAVVKDLKCYRKGKRGRPKKEKEPEYTIIGTLNESAVEWEAPPVDPLEEEKDKIRRSRNQDWKRFCARGYCGHTATGHKTDGKGACMISIDGIPCKCQEFL